MPEIDVHDAFNVQFKAELTIETEKNNLRL